MRYLILISLIILMIPKTFILAKSFEICPAEEFEILFPKQDQIIEDDIKIKIDKPEIYSKIEVFVDDEKSSTNISYSKLKFGKHTLKVLFKNSQNIIYQKTVNFIIKKPLKDFISEITDEKISKELKLINNLKEVRTKAYEKLKEINFQDIPRHKLLKKIYENYFSVLDEKIQNKFDKLIINFSNKKASLDLAKKFVLQELEKYKIVISEIAWMGTKASAYDEWIELYNPNFKDIKLDNWKLKIGDKKVILLSKIIKKREYFLLERSDDNTILNLEADLIYKGGLKNQGEKLVLISENGFNVDIVDCRNGWFAGDNELKRTMKRIYWFVDGSNADNWKTSEITEDSAIYLDAQGNKILGTPKSF